MPSGDVHYRYFKLGHLVEVPLSLFICFSDVYIGAGNLCGYMFHRYCDNDWDLMGVNMSEGRMVNEIPILGHFLFGVSSTYGSIFRRSHRSFITHFPFISTAFRILFVFTIPFIVLDYFGVCMIEVSSLKFYLGFWLGLSQADTIHYVLDLLYTE